MLCIPGTPLISTDKAKYHGNGTEYMVNCVAECSSLCNFPVLQRLFSRKARFVLSRLDLLFARFFDSSGNPRLVPNSRGKIRKPGAKETRMMRFFRVEIPSQDLAKHIQFIANH